MKNIKNKIAIFVVSCFALFALQTSASAVEGLSIGLGYHTGGAMGTGTEKKSDDTANTTEEDGAFAYDTPSVFVEFALNDQFSMGVEYHPDSIDTPQNLNKQDTAGQNGALLDNTVKASFEEHTTVYANINMPYNTYLRLGYVTDSNTHQTLPTNREV